MFLDRFSSHPPPSNSSNSSQRSYSPAPRRPNPLQSASSRPIPNLRSSSVTSLDSRVNSSSASLLGAARLPNGSGLRQSTVPPPDTKDSLLILQDIIGVTLNKQDDRSTKDGETPARLTEEVDFGGLNLEDYIHQYDEEAAEALNFRNVEECECVIYEQLMDVTG